jgi:hypothetical protein
MNIYILFTLAAIFNAIMDTLLWHYPTSVFKKLNEKWWNPMVSWQFQKNFLGIVRLDAWHLAKYGMLACFSFIAEYAHPVFIFWHIPLFFIVWCIGFELFYSKLLRRK